MKRGAVLAVGIAACGMLAAAGCGRKEAREASPAELKAGGELFARYCAGCHPDGGNAIYPQKTLHRIDLTANGITTPAGIVAKMRHPDPGMKQFDRDVIPDREAREIAQYILATFTQ